MPTLTAELDEKDDAVDPQIPPGAFDDADPGVPADQLEAPGTVRDLYSGKVWTLPTESMRDAGMAVYKSPRDFKKDPNFQYQSIRIDPDNNELPEYLSQDWVPVTRKELGMSDFVGPNGATPLDSYYVIDGKDIIVKIPREIAAMRYAANKALCDAAVSGAKKGTITARDKDGNLVKSHPAVEEGGEPITRELRNRTTVATNR